MDPFRDELGAAHSKIAELEKEKSELEARHQNEKQALEVRLDRALHPPASPVERQSSPMLAAFFVGIFAAIILLGGALFLVLR